MVINARKAVAHCRISVPLDRRDLGSWSLNTARADEDYDAGLNSPRPLPLGAWDPQRPGVDGRLLHFALYHAVTNSSVA